MTLEGKLAKLVGKNIDFAESCIECRVYSISKGIKLVVIGTEHQPNPLKIINVKMLKHVEIEVGNRVLLAFINGKIDNPVIVGVIK